MKAKRRFIVLVLFISLFVKSYAQFVPPPTMPNYGALQRPNIPYSHNFNYLNNVQRDISAKYLFTITLQNDSTFTTRTRIILSDTAYHSIVVKHKKAKQTLFPENTKSISRVDYDGKVLIGIPADSCWLFKCDAGRINSYSFLAEPGINYVIAIQKAGNNPIVPLTKENLKLMIGTDDSKILEFIERKKFIKAIELYNKK